MDGRDVQDDLKRLAESPVSCESFEFDFGLPKTDPQTGIAIGILDQEKKSQLNPNILPTGSILLRAAKWRMLQKWHPEFTPRQASILFFLGRFLRYVGLKALVADALTCSS